MADVATPVLVCISFVELLSSLTIDRRYLKSLTSSVAFAFVLMLVGVKWLRLLNYIQALCSSYLYQPDDEFLKFSLAISHQVNIISDA